MERKVGLEEKFERRGTYHLAGKDCDGEDKEAVEVCDYIPLGGEEGVEVGGEKAAHLHGGVNTFFQR